MKYSKALLGLAVAVLALSVVDARAQALRLKLDDQITPASAAVIAAAIAQAEKENSPVLIITLNTPGGLDVSMREIVTRIVESRVPVIVYVGPSGARAASAGFVILLASDLAAMAPGTATGAAHPVMMDGRDMDKTMAEKVVNDAAAFVRSFAEKRGRDAAAAESTIRDSKSFTEVEALNGRLIEVIARDEADVLEQAEGRTIQFAGTKQTLHTAGLTVRDYRTSLSQRLLMALADPRIAFVLFALGALCVYFEFQHPGAVVPGVVGALSVVLALYGFHMLPINLTGVLLIAAAVVLFVLEAKIQGFGILGLGGVVAAVIGSLILIDVPNPALQLPYTLVLAVVIPFAVILVFGLRLAIRARSAKVTTGMAGMVGLKGRAETAVGTDGKVFVRGELWRARSRMRIAPGEPVRVTGIDGLTLEVDVIPGDAKEPKEASAFDAG